MLGNLDPQVRHAVLKVFEIPKQRLVDARVRVPALVLTAGESVHVDDGVETLGSACVDDTVDKGKALGPNHGRVEVVDEVAVVDGDANTVEAERLEKAGILASEEVLEEAVKEEIVLFLSEDLQHGLPHLMLVAGISGDEVLHVGMATRGTLRIVSLTGTIGRECGVDSRP